jgi:ElaB/YqjD/DUF883 family membrane-anchored ribosome-binding protein
MNAKSFFGDTDPADVTKEQLIRDFKVVVADAEALIKATAGQGGDAVAAMRAKPMNMSMCIRGRPLASAQRLAW